MNKPSDVLVKRKEELESLIASIDSVLPSMEEQVALKKTEKEPLVLELSKIDSFLLVKDEIDALITDN